MNFNSYDSYNDNSSRRKRKLPKKLKIAVVVLVLIVFFSTLTIIPEGHIGTKYRMGSLVNNNLGAGPHLTIPFVENIKTIDIREQIYETVTTAYTKDTQTVEGIQIKVNYYYDTSMLPDIIRTIGVANVETKLIIPQLNSILKNTVGKYKAEELVQNRSLLQESVESELRESLAKNGIVISAVNIENIDFEDSFEQTIRDKVAAEQEALRVKNETAAKEEEARQLVIAAEAEAEAKRIQADADAYAIKVIQEQLTASPEYIDLIRAQNWNGVLPQVMGENINPFVALD